MTWEFHTTHRNPGPWDNGPRCRPNAISRNSCRVTGIRQHLCQRIFVLGDAVPNVSWRPFNLQPGANPVATGHQGRTRRCVFRFNIEIRETKTFGGEAIDIGRRRSAQNSSAINADFAVSEIVHQYEDNVRFARIPGCSQDRESPHQDRNEKYSNSGSSRTSRHYPLLVW